MSNRAQEVDRADVNRTFRVCIHVWWRGLEWFIRSILWTSNHCFDFRGDKIVIYRLQSLDYHIICGDFIKMRDCVTRDGVIRWRGLTSTPASGDGESSATECSFVWNLSDLTLYSWLIINPIIRTINLVATSWPPDSHATARRLSSDCRDSNNVPRIHASRSTENEVCRTHKTDGDDVVCSAPRPLPPPCSSMHAAHCSLCVKSMLDNLGNGRIYRKSNIDTSEVTWRHIDRWPC